ADALPERAITQDMMQTVTQETSKGLLPGDNEAQDLRDEFFLAEIGFPALDSGDQIAGQIILQCSASLLNQLHDVVAVSNGTRGTFELAFRRWLLIEQFEPVETPGLNLLQISVWHTHDPENDQRRERLMQAFHQIGSTISSKLINQSIGQ